MASFPGVRRFAPWRRSRRLVLWALVGLALTLVGSGFSGCRLDLAQAPTAPIRIGVIASLSGDDLAVGQATVDGATLAADQINADEGLLVQGIRHPVELVVADTQSTPEGAIKAAQALINQEQVVAIVGPQYSRYAIPVSQLAEKAQIPMISPRSTSPETTRDKRYVFRAIFTDEFQGRVLARFAREDLNHQKAAVLYDVASPYNRGIATMFQQEFTRLGGEIVAFEAYTTGNTDFLPQFQAIQAARPEIVFLPNYENEIPNQARQLRQLGIRATLLGSDSWGSMQSSDLTDALEGAYFSDHYVPQADDAVTQEFIQAFEQAYRYLPPAGAAATYDSLGILFQAIRDQDSLEPEGIRQGIATLGDYSGVTGRLKYQSTGDPLVSVTILKITDGQPVFYKKIDP